MRGSASVAHCRGGGRGAARRRYSLHFDPEPPSMDSGIPLFRDVAAPTPYRDGRFGTASRGFDRGARAIVGSLSMAALGVAAQRTRAYSVIALAVDAAESLRGCLVQRCRTGCGQRRPRAVVWVISFPLLLSHLRPGRRLPA